MSEGDGQEIKASVSALARNYDFFKALHDDERNRGTRLGQLAAALLGVEGLFIGAVAFKFADVSRLAEAIQVPPGVFLVSLTLTLVALTATIRAIAIRTHEGLAHPRELATKLEQAPDDEAAFLLHRCMDYAVAAENNSEVNDKRASALNWAGWLVFTAIIVLGLAAVIALIGSVRWLNVLRCVGL